MVNAGVRAEYKWVMDSVKDAGDPDGFGDKFGRFWRVLTEYPGTDPEFMS